MAVRAALDGELDGAPPSPTNVLVRSSAMAGEGEIPGRLLQSLAPAQLLGIGLQSGDARFARLCRAHLDRPPAGIGVVDVGGDGSAMELPPDRVTGVAEPSDLTGIGMAMAAFLRGFDGGPPTVLCFDDLTPLVEFVEPDRTTRFLGVTTDRFDTAYTFAVASINPLAHDDDVLSTLATAFDVVVEDDGDGGWTVRHA